MGELADDAVEGWCCEDCCIYFEKEHGHPVLCGDCYAKQWATTGKQPLTSKATHQEM